MRISRNNFKEDAGRRVKGVSFFIETNEEEREALIAWLDSNLEPIGNHTSLRWRILQMVSDQL